MEYFVLYKQGVYISEIIGVFSSAEEAEIAFRKNYDIQKRKKQEICHDFDGYHHFTIENFLLNKAGNEEGTAIDLEYEPF